MSTEKKGHSVLARLDKIKKYHYEIFLLQNEFDERCAFWGAFPPECWWNADHVPAPFCLAARRSLNMKGSPCWIAVFGPSGLEKRMATLHPCIRARGDQLKECWIIFRPSDMSDEV